MSSFRNSLSQFQNSFHIFFSFHFEFIWIIEAEQKTKFVENEIFQLMNAGPIKKQIMCYILDDERKTYMRPVTIPHKNNPTVLISKL